MDSPVSPPDKGAGGLGPLVFSLNSPDKGSPPDKGAGGLGPLVFSLNSPDKGEPMQAGGKASRGK